MIDNYEIIIILRDRELNNLAGVIVGYSLRGVKVNSSRSKQWTVPKYSSDKVKSSEVKYSRIVI